MDEIEGRLLAHRRLLAEIVRHLPGAGLDDWLASRSVMRDGQEDPGAVLTGAEGLSLSLAEEYREIAALLDHQSSETTTSSTTIARPT